ncbi:MAG: GNAT family N-acetyltransferase [Elusimicrobiota bacterium]
MGDLKLVRLDRRHIGDFERLLGSKEFGGCFCAFWNNPGSEWEARCKERPVENFEDTRRRVIAGEPRGFLAVREMDGAVVGWTGSGPKTAFPALKERPGSRLGPWEDSVWAVGCLAVGFPYRGLGYSKQIVALLVEEAKSAGAKTIEAYPLDPAGEDSAWRGLRPVFESHGFTVASAEPLAEGGPQVLRMERSL